MLNVQTILLPVDFSECSQAAFQIARALARDYHARLAILHVPVPPPFVTPGELNKVLQGPGGYRGELEDMLRQFYPSDSPAGVEYRIQEGDPTVEILAVAREGRCDLIVMGTHGRTGVGRLLMGRVAEKVLRKAACPVLTVKAPLTSASAGVAAMPEHTSEPEISRSDDFTVKVKRSNR